MSETRDEVQVEFGLDLKLRLRLHRRRRQLQNRHDVTPYPMRLVVGACGRGKGKPGAPLGLDVWIEMTFRDPDGRQC